MKKGSCASIEKGRKEVGEQTRRVSGKKETKQLMMRKRV